MANLESFFKSEKTPSGEVIYCLTIRLSKDEEKSYFKSMTNFDITRYKKRVILNVVDDKQATLQFKDCKDFKVLVEASNYHVSCYNDTKNQYDLIISDCIQAMIYCGILK